MKTARKLDHFKAYAGPAMNQKIALMKAEGRDVINLGLGGYVEHTDDKVVEKPDGKFRIEYRITRWPWVKPGTRWGSQRICSSSLTRAWDCKPT